MNQSAHEQAPRESLMLLAQNPETNVNNFCAGEDQGISTSDRFAQRVVSLGPHGYIN